MARAPDQMQLTPPVDETLRRVVVTYRLLTLVWIWILVGVTVARNGAGDRGVFAATVALATLWAGVTIWVGRDSRRLGGIMFVAADGLVALALSSAGLIAGASDFVSGGWPGSWLFVVAFAANLRWTVGASLVLMVEHVILHLAHGLEDIRVAGTFQFVVLAVIIGWAFDALRERERIRLELQEQLDAERQALASEREATARHEERAALARQLHDEVLQTLHAINVDAEDAGQVRYFARRQTRELRRTIEEFRSPFDHSFRASLLRHRDEVEDLYRGVKINDVIRTDAAMTPPLEAALGAAREAMVNAAKHSGASEIDLYSEIEDELAVIHVRDRGAGFDSSNSSGHGLAMSMIGRVEEQGGTVQVRSAPGDGTNIRIEVPLE